MTANPRARSAPSQRRRGVVAHADVADHTGSLQPAHALHGHLVGDDGVGPRTWCRSMTSTPGRRRLRWARSSTTAARGITGNSLVATNASSRRAPSPRPRCARSGRTRSLLRVDQVDAQIEGPLGDPHRLVLGVVAAVAPLPRTELPAAQADAGHPDAAHVHVAHRPARYWPAPDQRGAATSSKARSIRSKRRRIMARLSA